MRVLSIEEMLQVAGGCGCGCSHDGGGSSGGHKGTGARGAHSTHAKGSAPKPKTSDKGSHKGSVGCGCGV
jgi:hypothetical protein